MKTKQKQALNILLADDDEDDRLLFREAVEETYLDDHLNLNLNMVKDGEELIRYISKHPKPPEIIFLDLNMPRKNGFECLYELRKDKKFKDVFIAIYSTSSAERDVDEAFNKGANLYTCKPNSFGKLKILINEILHLDRSRFSPCTCRKAFLLNVNESVQ